MTLKFNRVLEVVEVHTFMQNFIKLSAAVHELSCAQGNKKKLCWKQYCRRYRADSNKSCNKQVLWLWFVAEQVIVTKSKWA